jgi:hypothetical protein
MCISSMMNIIFTYLKCLIRKQIIISQEFLQNCVSKYCDWVFNEAKFSMAVKKKKACLKYPAQTILFFSHLHPTRAMINHAAALHHAAIILFKRI